jgi:hypothetical protein
MVMLTAFLLLQSTIYNTNGGLAAIFAKLQVNLVSSVQL